jgi:uncharacterized protein with PIN domain
MTTEERFERIEVALQATSEGLLQTQTLLKTVLEMQSRNQETLSAFMESISDYVDKADVRMKRIEENMDTLIRANTAEHGNGKGNH